MSELATPPDKVVQLLGRYQISQRLGEGAMGTVYRGHDPLLDRALAIKTVNLAVPIDDRADYEARFYQEAKAAGSLNHPNIVVIYDIGKTDTVAFMAMEFIEGRELRSILAHGTPLPVTHAVYVAAQVADALAYAHNRGVVHRDIKPTNIMITSDGLVKLTDFGIARMRSSEVKTMTGVILGSPRYMSPEQAAGKRADYRSDIFSLGVVLYEMLTGQAPFHGDSLAGLMYQTVNANPAPPKSLNPALPKVLDFIVAKALAKAPEARYQSARELADDLRDSIETPSSRDLEQQLLARLREPSTQGVDAPTVKTRATDNDDTVPMSGSADNLGVEEFTNSFGVSNAFDSHEATLRLQRAEEAPAARRDAATLTSSARSTKKSRSQTPLLWIAVAAIVVAAIYLIQTL